MLYLWRETLGRLAGKVNTRTSVIKLMKNKDAIEKRPRLAHGVTATYARSKVYLAPFLVAASFLLFSSFAHAAETLDAYYDTGDGGITNVTNIIAQSWTAISTGNVPYIDVMIDDNGGNCVDGGIVRMYILPSSGGNPVIGNQKNLALRTIDVDCVNIPSTPTWIRFTATSTLPVVSGTKYIIALRDTTYNALWSHNVNGSYTGGQQHYCDGGSDSCALWDNDVRAFYDSLFRVYVSDATPPPPPAASASGPVDGSINVVKTVVNDSGGTSVVADFPLFVNGARVVSGATNRFPAPASVYTVTETPVSNYVKSFSGDCDLSGQLNLGPGENKFCIVTNDDIGAPVVVPPVPPLIDVVKVPNPLALPTGPGSVTYVYSLRNVGVVPVTDITMEGDTCSPIILSSGDANNDKKLDVNETWMYLCSTTLSETHTNTIVATGWANGISAVDIASATVVVGMPVVPPLIHVTQVPSPLALSAGGEVIYNYTVTNPGSAPLSDVSISDDMCTGLPGRVFGHPGDINKNNLLESSEAWSFTCQSVLTKTTTNIGTARGSANGLVARDFAVATVVVAIPGLPNTGSSASNFGQEVRSIVVDLWKGKSGNDVSILQQFLISQNKGPAALALGQVGATAYFGTLTRAALAEFQLHAGISPPLGYFGPITRAYVSTH